MELTEEALQQSAASPGENGVQLDIGAHDPNTDASAGSDQHPLSAVHTPNDHSRDDVEMTDRNEAISQEGGAAGSEATADGEIVYEDDDEDADGEADDDYEFMNGQVSQHNEYPDGGGGASPETAEGNTDHEEDDEGVGAVKIRPGETDDEDNRSEATAPTVSEAESEDDAEWDGEEEVVDNDDEDSDNAQSQSNNCVFCKENEENDPGEEFEAYLACSVCGENGE